MIQSVNRVTQTIDYFIDFIGRAVSWLTIAMVITTLVVVVSRYFLQIGSIALQESVTYLHAAVYWELDTPCNTEGMFE
jgi:TRAP-type mannitol/chloroaromatic compound transport system permease small subunit